MNNNQIEKFLNLGYDIGYDLTDYTKDVLFLDDLRKVLRDGISLELFVRVYGFKRSSKEIRNLRTLGKYKLEFPTDNRFVLDAMLEEEGFHIYAPLIVNQLNEIDLSFIKSKELAAFIIAIIKKGYSTNEINVFLKNHAKSFPNSLLEHYAFGFLATSRSLEKASIYIEHMTEENCKILYRYVLLDEYCLTPAILAVINNNKFTLKEKDLVILKTIYPDFISKLNDFKENNLFVKNDQVIGYKNLSHEQGYKYNSVVSLPLTELPDAGLTAEQLIMISFISKNLNPEVKSNKIYASNYIDILELLTKYPAKSNDRFSEVDLELIPYELKGINVDTMKSYSPELAAMCAFLERLDIHIKPIDFEISKTIIPYILPTAILDLDIFKMFSFWIDSIDEETRILECIYITLWGGQIFDLLDDGINIQKVKNTRYELTTQKEW